MGNQETGWSVESKLLQYILKQLQRLIQVVSNFASTVPTLLSQLINDIGFITGADVPSNEEDPIVGGITGIPTSDGAGNISQASAEVYKIKVLTTAEYTTLNPKVDTTLYVIIDPTTTTTTTVAP